MSKIKHAFFLAGFTVAEVLLIFSLTASQVYAEVGTRVSGLISDDAVWDERGSPYIFEADVVVAKGAELRVGPGVEIRMLAGVEPPSLIVQGDLIIEGSGDEPVDISEISKVFSTGAEVRISNAYVHDGPLLILHRSKVVIASSTFSKAPGSAILVWGSDLKAENIRLQDNSFAGIFVTKDFGSGVEPSVSVHFSSFERNGRPINNESLELVRAEHNWWGSPNGPDIVTSASIKGPVSYSPWLTELPSKPTCCSSVLFIPGLEGTRLHMGSNQLWEPNANADVEKLYMDEQGFSTDAAIYSSEPIVRALGIKPIYSGFLEFLKGLPAENGINEARAFGYDWRKPVDSVVLGREVRATSTDSLLDTITHMASSSKTGKVTVIAHSNGGLIAKYLVKVLADTGRAELIDKVISVAVPYLGTPEALLGLLHGDHQSILGGLVLSQPVARKLGENMPSAYTLLPSAEYFKKAFGPAIAFASTTIKGLNDGSYPSEIDSAPDQTAFILDENKGRMKPAFADVRAPIIGNAFLLRMAEALHAILDPFVWPAHIVRFAIVGWNLDTTTGITYHEKRGCDTLISRLWCGGSEFFHRIATSLSGDGTVLALSADHGSGDVIPIDLKKVSTEESTNISHANILEASTTRAVIREILAAGNETVTRLPALPLEEPESITIGVRGPVELYVQGSKVRSTGPADDAYSTVKVPKAAGEKYSVLIRGTDFGFFIFEIGEVQYAMMPASPFMAATTTVAEGTARVLLVDVNDDGAADYVSAPGGNGLPGNASSTEAAERIALEQSLEVLEKTDTLEMRNDPRWLQFLEKVSELTAQNFHGKDGQPTPAPVIAPLPAPAPTLPQQKTPPEGGVACPK